MFTVRKISTRIVPHIIGGVFLISSVNAEPLSLTRVVIEGARRINEAAIVAQLKHSKGVVSEDQLSEDLKNLYRTGFFDRISVELRYENEDAVLVYKVTEKPTLRKVFVKGNEEVKESDLSQVFNLGTRRFLDKGRLDAMVKSAVALYQKKGFYDASISYDLAKVSDDQVDVTFKVSEGRRFTIERVNFRGLSKIDEDDLRSKLETKRYKWWSSWLFGTGRVDRDKLEGDKAIISQELLDHGLIDGTVSDPSIDRVGEDIVITFDIVEGTQYSIGSISVSGDLIDGDPAKTLSGISLSKGDIFSASKARKDAFAISDKFSDIGYAFVNVVPKTNINREERTIGLDYGVAKGEKVTVRNVSIKGNTKTYDNVIRRDVKIPEGKTFSSSKVRRTETLLRRLGYFEEVSVSSEPVEGRKDQIDLSINVREGSTGTFSAGAGYSTTDGAIFNSTIAENNLFGTGRQLSLNVDVGSLQNNAILAFTDPRVDDSQLSAGVELQHATRELIDFSRSATGGGVTLGYPLENVLGEWAEDINGSLRYDLLEVEILDVQEQEAADIVIASEGKSTISAITPQLIRNTIDNPLNPTRGVRQVLGFEFAGLGGDQDYYVLSGYNSWYTPVAQLSNGPLIFSIRTRIDYGDSLNDDIFPLFKRYFPGGINSVRGFRNRTLGPRDDKNRQYGGSKQFINNVEIIAPLIQAAGINGVVFYDLGEAFDDNQSIEFSALRRAYGAGIRWASPMGPIRIEFGFPGDKREGERGMVTLFSFGAPL